MKISGAGTGGLIISAFLLLNGCRDKGKPPAGQAQTAVREYAVINIDRRKAVLNTDFPATIQGQQNIEIRPKIDGYVDAIYVDEGATVRKGQLLFRISAPQYEQEVRTAEANVKIAQADVNAAQMQVNKVRPLVQKQIISQYELESSQYTLQSRQAALAQARANLENARTNLGYTTIYSPVNGIVGTIPYKVGSLVSSNTPDPLTTVSNIGNIYAYFSINQSQALNFFASAKGNTIQEKLATLPPVTLILPNGLEFPQHGRIETVSGQVNTQTGSLNVRATFPNPRGVIRSGSSAIVRLPITIDTALLVPQRATFEIQGKTFVYVAGTDNKVRSVQVTVSADPQGKFFVVRQGLQPGDKVVVEGIASLREEAPIRPRLVNADSVYNTLQ